MWELDAGQPIRTDDYVIARDPESRFPSCREWHRVRRDFLKDHGVITPNFGTDTWEVDWSKRIGKDNGRRVWARNPNSKKVAAREWRWVSYGTLRTAGIKWVSRNTGRHMNINGYWMLTKSALSAEEIKLAEGNSLFQRVGNVWTVLEHRLVAVKKYGSIPKGNVVRHLNGDKTDNRPENLVTGTHKDNWLDHQTAVKNAMYWRERAEIAERKLAEYEARI